MCKAYLKRGGRILGPGQHWRKGKTKLSASQIAWATSKPVIVDQVGLSLKQRVAAIGNKFNVAISPGTLQNYYKAAAIKYRYPARSLDSAWSEEQLRPLRVNFLYQLHHHVKNGTIVWWADQMSTNVWERLSRVWQLPGKFRVKQSTVWPSSGPQRRTQARRRGRRARQSPCSPQSRREGTVPGTQVHFALFAAVFFYIESNRDGLVAREEAVAPEAA